MIDPKKYLAKIIDYSIIESQSGIPQVVILFEFLTEDGMQHQLNWYGSFKEGKAREITIDTLLKCGFNGDDLSQLALGKESKALDINKILEIDIVREEHNGVPRIKIKWINLPPSSGYKKWRQDQAQKWFSEANIGTDLMRRRKI